MNDVFLMSPPRPDWKPRGKKNFLSTQSDAPIEEGAAFKEWRELADAILSAGGEVLVLPAPEHPNLTGLTYTAESGLFCWKGGKPIYLLPNVNPEHRIPEADYVEKFVQKLGWKTHRIQAKWEGQGDVFQVSPGRYVHTYGTGKWARSSKEAFAEVTPFLEGENVQIRFNADPWFHGNTLFAVFHSKDGEPAFLVCPDALDDSELTRLMDFLGPARVLRIDSQASLSYATNALQVGTTVIAPNGMSEEILGFWRALGLDVLEMEMPVLFKKGGGAGVCLTHRLHGLDPSLLPRDLCL